MKNKFLNTTAAGLIIAVSSLLSSAANAGIIKVNDSDFNSGAGNITFSEFALNTINPTYNYNDYGGLIGNPTVNFGGWFTGQVLSATPGADCPGAAASACIVGAPTGSLSLDANSTQTSIVSDGGNPTSPVLSGSPLFNGGIAVLFSNDQYGVGFDGGFFNAIGSTAITAFARDGSLLGSVANTQTGIEFLGLVSDDNTARIAGVFLDLVGAEPAGFAIDNIRFGSVSDLNIDTDNTSVPEPSSFAIFALGMMGFVSRRLKK